MNVNQLEKMTVDELISEMHKQNEIAGNARRIADECEERAVSKFLIQNNLNGIVLHKPTGKKGFLHKNHDYRGLVVEFYPLKKNGEESIKKCLDCTEWVACYSHKENFKIFLEKYEPVK